MGNKTKTENEESNLRHNVPLKSVKEDFVSSTMFLRIVTAIKNTFVKNFFIVLPIFKLCSPILCW